MQHIRYFEEEVGMACLRILQNEYQMQAVARFGNDRIQEVLLGPVYFPHNAFAVVPANSIANTATGYKSGLNV
jgi:hypothetical protein